MFSYDNYREIIKLIKKSGRGSDFSGALNKDEFIIMRHDVEFSVERAYALSEVELEMGFSSSFFLMDK